MRIPKELLAGDSKSWDDDPSSDNLGNSIDSSWTLTYYLRGKSSLNLTASAQGSGWRTAITATQSAELIPGVYYWQAQAVSGSTKVTLGTGQLKILPNLSAAGENYDGRSQARKDLDSVQAAIRSIAASGIAEYTINGRQARKLDLPALILLESKLKVDVVREEKAEMIKNGKGDPHTLYVRFKK